MEVLGESRIEADSGPNLTVAWNILVANVVAATGAPIAAWFIAGSRFATPGIPGVGVGLISLRNACVRLLPGMVAGLVLS